MTDNGKTVTMERMNDFFGYDVRERLIGLGYTTEEEISEQIRLIKKLFVITDEIIEEEGMEAALKFVNGIMVKQYLNN